MLGVAALACLNAAHAQQPGLDPTDVVGATPTVSADLGFRGRAGTQGRLRAAAQRSVNLGLEFQTGRNFMAVGESTSVTTVTDPPLEGDEELDVELFFVNTSTMPFSLLPGEYVTFTSQSTTLTADNPKRTVTMTAALSLPGNRSVTGAVWAVAAQARNVTVVGTLDPEDAFRDAERDVEVGAGPTYSQPYTIGSPDFYDLVITPQTVEVAPGECAGFTVRTRQALLDDDSIRLPFDFDDDNFEDENDDDIGDFIGFNSDRKQRTGSTTIRPGAVLVHIWNVRIGGPDADTYDGAVPAPGQSYTEELCASATAEVGRTFVSEIDGGLDGGSDYKDPGPLNVTVVASNPFTAFLSPGVPADLPAGFASDSTAERGALSLGGDPTGMITVSLDENDRVRGREVRVGLEVVPAGSPLSLSESEVTLAPPDYTAAVSATVPLPRRVGAGAVRTTTRDSAAPVDSVELPVVWERDALPRVTVSLEPAGTLALKAGASTELRLTLEEFSELPAAEVVELRLELDAAGPGLSLSPDAVVLSSAVRTATVTLATTFGVKTSGTLRVAPSLRVVLREAPALAVSVELPRVTVSLEPAGTLALKAGASTELRLTLEEFSELPAAEVVELRLELDTAGPGLSLSSDAVVLSSAVRTATVTLVTTFGVKTSGTLRVAPPLRVELREAPALAVSVELPRVTVSLEPAGTLALKAGASTELRLTLEEFSELPAAEVVELRLELDATGPGLSLSSDVVVLSSAVRTATVTLTAALDVKISGTLRVAPSLQVELREAPSLAVSVGLPRVTVSLEPAGALALKAGASTELRLTLEEFSELPAAEVVELRLELDATGPGLSLSPDVVVLSSAVRTATVTLTAALGTGVSGTLRVAPPLQVRLHEAPALMVSVELPRVTVSLDPVGTLALKAGASTELRLTLEEFSELPAAEVVELRLELDPTGSGLSLSSDVVVLSSAVRTATVTLTAAFDADVSGTLRVAPSLRVELREAPALVVSVELPRVTVSLDPPGAVTLTSGDERDVVLRLDEYGELSTGREVSLGVNLDTADDTGLSLSRGETTGVKVLGVELSARTSRATITLVSSYNRTGTGTLSVSAVAGVTLRGDSVTSLEATVASPRLTAWFVASDADNPGAASDEPATFLNLEQGEVAVYVRLCSPGDALCREADSPLRGRLRGQNVVLQASVSDGFTIETRRADRLLEFDENRVQEEITVEADGDVISGVLTLSAVSGVTLVNAAGDELPEARLRVQIGEHVGTELRVKVFLEGALE